MTAHQQRVERTQDAIVKAWNRAGRPDEWAWFPKWHLRNGGRAPGEGPHKLDPHVCSTCNSGPTADMNRHNSCLHCWRARLQLGDNWRPRKGAR